jgi:MFS family permease
MSRNFRLFWTGQAISHLGTWVHFAAQSWLVLEMTGSPFSLGLMGLVQAVPILLLSLFGGVAADRYDRRRVLIVTQACFMACAAGPALLLLKGLLTFPLLLVFTAFTGVLHALDYPTRQAFLSEIVEPDEITRAVALTSAGLHGARIAGPALAGVLIQIVDVAGCFLLNSLTFLAVIAALLMMRLPPAVRRPARDASRSRLVEGAKFFASDGIALGLVLMIAVFSFFGTSYLVLLPVVAREILGEGPGGYGLLFTGVAAGAAASSLLLGALRTVPGRGKLLLLPCVLFPAGMLLFSMSRNYAWSLALLAGAGFLVTGQSVIASGMLQMRAPPEMRGRVMSFYTLAFIGLVPLGGFCAGALATWAGVARAFALGGGAVAAASLVLLIRLKGLFSTS